MRRVVLAFVALLVSALPAAAGIGSWTGGGPQGGEVLDLQLDPDLPQVSYLRTASNGLFRSADAGATWSRANAGLPPRRLSDFAVAGGGTLFAVSPPASEVWKSLDGGASWHTTRSPVPGGLAAWGVAADPSTPGTIWVAALEGNDTRVFRSDDSGEHWSLVSSLLPEPLELTTTPLRPGSLFLSTRNSLLLRSDDGGRTWTTMGEARHWRELAIDVGAPNRLLTVRSNYPYLYESLDDGRTWHFLTALDVPVWFDPAAIEVDPLDRNRVTIAFQYHLWESTDGGLTWEGTKPAGAWFLINDLVALSTGTQRRMLLTPEGIYQGSDGYGVLSVEGLEARAPDVVWAAPESPNVVAVGRFPSGPWVSVDGGVQWRPRHQGLLTHGLWNVAFAGTPNASMLYVGVAGRLWRSKRGGRWATIETDPALVNITIIDVLPSGRILVARFAHSTLAFASDDGGRSWVPYYSPTEASFSYPLDLSVDPTDEEIGLIASLEQEPAGCVVDRTTDGGRTWERVLNDELGYCESVRLERDPSSSQTVYLLSRLIAPSTGNATPVDQLLRSLDGGATWEPIGNTLPCFGAVAVDPRNSDVYVGCDRIYVSQDTGLSWEPFDDSGFPADLRFISALTAVPDGAGVTLHAGTNAGTYSYTLAR